MSEIFLGYLVNSILRGGILVLMLLIAEFALRRRMLFAGGRTLYLLAMVLVSAAAGTALRIPLRRLATGGVDRSAVRKPFFTAYRPGGNIDEFRRGSRKRRGEIRHRTADSPG